MNGKNYGYKPPVFEQKDFILGGDRSAPFTVLMPSGDWRPWLPPGESQKRGSLDTNSCTNFAWLNGVETFLKCLFTEDKNFAERFLAIVSQQQRDGNDPQKVAEAIRKFGLIEEWKLPFVDGMTWETYFTPNPMSQPYLEDGKKFLAGYDFKHEYLFHNNGPTTKVQAPAQRALIIEGLKRSPVVVSVYAWFKQGDKYVKPAGVRDTHLAVIVYHEPGKGYFVYDSYPEDGEYIKLLDEDFTFEIAKGFVITKKEPPLSAFKRIVEGFKALLQFLARDPRIIEEVAPPAPIPAPIPEPVPEPVIPPSRLEDLCLSIRKMEGWRVGSRSWRNNNPGNLKCTSYTLSLGAVRADKDGFAVFLTPEAGMGALRQFLKDAAAGELRAYKKGITLQEFFGIYAPAEDMNDPKGYAFFVAKDLGVPVTTPLATLV